jgi:hypothetical protein
MADERKRSPRVVRDPDVPVGAPGSLRLDRGEPRAKPLGASEVARAFLQRVAQTTGEHSNVELSRNAKGDTQIKVAVRTGDSEGVATIEDAAAKAKEVYDLLRSFYPMPSPEPSRDTAVARQSAAKVRHATAKAE